MLNASLPHRYGWVAREFLYGLKSHHGEFEPCVLFGVTAVPGRALSFNLICESGAMWTRIPIHAIYHELPTLEQRHALDCLQVWDSFGVDFAVTTYEYLQERRATAMLSRDREPRVPVRYWTTLDFYANGYSDSPIQHKQFHLCALEDGTGQFCALPGNHLVWDDPSFTRAGHSYDYRRTAPTIWRSEG